MFWCSFRVLGRERAGVGGGVGLRGTRCSELEGFNYVNPKYEAHLVAE